MPMTPSMRPAYCIWAPIRKIAGISMLRCTEFKTPWLYSPAAVPMPPPAERTVESRTATASPGRWKISMTGVNRVPIVSKSPVICRALINIKAMTTLGSILRAAILSPLRIPSRKESYMFMALSCSVNRCLVFHSGCSADTGA